MIKRDIFANVEWLLVPPDSATFALIFLKIWFRGFEFFDEFGDVGFVHIWAINELCMARF